MTATIIFKINIVSEVAQDWFSNEILVAEVNFSL